MASAELEWAKQKIAEDRARAGVKPEGYDVAAARASLPETELPLPSGLTIMPENHHGVECMRVQARDADPERIILYLHGGGFLVGGFHSHKSLAGWLSHHTGATVVFPEYRLAPEHRFPAGLEDCFAAYKGILETPPKRLHVMGDSAGGALSVSVFQMARAAGLRLPDSIAVLCGMLDLNEESSSFLQLTQRTRDGVRLYVSHLKDLADPLASAMEADLDGMPPLLVQTGTDDYCSEDCERFARKAEAAGVTTTFENWPNMIHVWHRFAPKLPEANEALARIARWLSQVEKGEPAALAGE